MKQGRQVGRAMSSLRGPSLRPYQPITPSQRLFQCVLSMGFPSRFHQGNLHDADMSCRTDPMPVVALKGEAAAWGCR